MGGFYNPKGNVIKSQRSVVEELDACFSSGLWEIMASPQDVDRGPFLGSVILLMIPASSR